MKKIKKQKMNSTDKFMNEVIIYGGLPMRRADVYRDALEQTGSRKAADVFAFSHSAQIAPEGTLPLSFIQFRKLTASSKPRISGKSLRISPKMPKLK